MSYIAIISISLIFLISSLLSADNNTIPPNLSFPNKIDISGFKFPDSLGRKNNLCPDYSEIGYRKGAILLGELNLFIDLIAEENNENPRLVEAIYLSGEKATKILREAGGNSLHTDRGKLVLGSFVKDHSRVVLFSWEKTKYLFVGYTKKYQERLGLIIPGVIINLLDGLNETTFAHKMGWKRGSGELCTGCFPSPNDACVSCPGGSKNHELSRRELWTYPENEVLPLPFR